MTSPSGIPLSFSWSLSLWDLSRFISSISFEDRALKDWKLWVGDHRGHDQAGWWGQGSLCPQAGPFSKPPGLSCRWEGCLAQGHLCRGCKVLPLFKKNSRLLYGGLSMKPACSGPPAFSSPGLSIPTLCRLLGTRRHLSAQPLWALSIRHLAESIPSVQCEK